MKLAAEDISFDYGSTPILDRVSLQVEPGVVFGLLGANGAGKSTVLRILNGMLQAREGRVIIENQPLSQMSVREIACAMAMVPQNPKALFGFTVREMVTMGRRPHHTLMSSLDDKDFEAIDAALEDCGLQELSERPVTELSGGEIQLTFVARALAQQTDILLLDEATSNLDIKHTSTILSIVRKRAAHGLAVVSIVHDLNTAVSFCDVIAFLCNGSLIGPAAPRDLITPEIIATVYGAREDRIRIHHDPFFVECQLS